MNQKKLHILSLLAALTAATIFGMSFMFSKMALVTAAPTVLLAFRFTVAVAAMSLVIALNALVGKVRGKPLFAFSLKGKPVGKLLLLGIVQPVAYFIFENYGILYTSAAVAGTIIAAVPVCCILMDVLVLHERVTRRQVLCALGAIGGVALISVGGAVMISALGLLFLLLIAAVIVGSLTAAGGECEEHDGRQQEGGKGSELHGGGFLSCDEVDFFKNRGVLLSTPSAHSRCRQKTKP